MVRYAGVTAALAAVAWPVWNVDGLFDFSKPVRNDAFGKASPVSKYHLCAAYYSWMTYKLDTPNVVIRGQCDGDEGKKSIAAFTGTVDGVDWISDAWSQIGGWSITYPLQVNWRVVNLNIPLEGDDGPYLNKGESLVGDQHMGHKGAFSLMAKDGNFIIRDAKNKNKRVWSHRGDTMKLNDDCNVEIRKDGKLIHLYESLTKDDLEKMPRNVFDLEHCRLKMSEQGVLYVAMKDKDFDITVYLPIITPADIDDGNWFRDNVHLKRLEPNDVKVDLCTGHSLGGAMAKMHSHFDRCKDALITFASPRVTRDIGNVGAVRDYIRYGFSSCKGGEEGEETHLRDIVTTIPGRRAPSTANPIFLTHSHTHTCEPDVEKRPSSLAETHNVFNYALDTRRVVNFGQPHFQNLYHMCDAHCEGQHRCPSYCGVGGVCCVKGDAQCGNKHGYANFRTCQFVPQQNVKCTAPSDVELAMGENMKCKLPCSGHGFININKEGGCDCDIGFHGKKCEKQDSYKEGVPLPASQDIEPTLGKDESLALKPIKLKEDKKGDKGNL